MKKFLLFFALMVICSSCKKTEKTNKLKIVDWLIGSWENNMEQGRLSETWEKINDSTYNGSSFFIKEKDTLNNEVIVLKQKGNEVYYIPTVKGQNNDQPVVFKMVTATSKQIIFANSQHDFPKKIVYRQITTDSIVAEISGIENGKSTLESYSMVKKKP